MLDQADLSANREAYEARAKGEDGRVKATKARGFTFFGVVTSAQKEHKKAERRKAAAVKKFMSLDKVRVEGNFFGKGARGEGVEEYRRRERPVLPHFSLTCVPPSPRSLLPPPPRTGRARLTCGRSPTGPRRWA